MFDVKAHFEDLAPKFIDWEFYEPYTKLEPPFGQLGLPVFLRTYSRYLPKQKRREKWVETVLRNVEFSIGLDKKSPAEGLKKEAQMLFDAMFNLRCFPSGRSLWVAGTKQTEVDPSSVWNCTFCVINSISCFSEIFYWLLIGAGTGCSVEEKYTSNLPVFYNNKQVIHAEKTDWVKGEFCDETNVQIMYSEGERFYFRNTNFKMGQCISTTN